MTNDLNTLTKQDLNAKLAEPLTPAQLKKTSKDDLISRVVETADLVTSATTEPEKPRLTARERKLLTVHLELTMAAMGGETVDEVLSDNMSVTDIAELARTSELKPETVKGVVGSLTKKGLVAPGDTNPETKQIEQWLTEDGVRVAFDCLAEDAERHSDNFVTKTTPAAKADKPAAKPARELDDRVITEPATDLKDVKATTEGSKRHLLAQALERGATLEHLMEVTGWNRSTTQSALKWDMGQMGLGVERKGGKYFLMLPAGVKRLPVRDKTVSRSDALVAACK